ncbi:MAG: LPS assembly lipoprotein LptE [Burkholderiaceae bacterium]
MAVSRRTLWLAALGGGVLAASLSGCGFALRQPTQLPFTKLAISGFKPASPMAEALRRSLPATVTVVAQPRDAEVVLVVLEDRYDKTVAASTAGGQVVEFRLRVTLRFRLDKPDGSPRLAEQRLELTRDMSYSETAALAKQAEEAGLVREMRMDLAQQLLQMLAVSGKPAA